MVMPRTALLSCKDWPLESHLHLCLSTPDKYTNDGINDVLALWTRHAKHTERNVCISGLLSYWNPPNLYIHHVSCGVQLGAYPEKEAPAQVKCAYALYCPTCTLTLVAFSWQHFNPIIRKVVNVSMQY